ncbi:hypothetical protein M9458_057620 [Cirrhinus mrigala]|uniref:Retrotransposon gag domain-containing protein n=1 Tax=Cirrhinus mrigala TaxID=683832 RepID=A0ABD0MEJ4_CIRMR
MNPAERLLGLRQGNRPIEAYVEDFCELCYQVDFNNTFKDIFRFGLSKDISCFMPRNTPHWILEKYIDFALSGSPYTVGIVDEGPRNPAVTTKPQPAHVMFSTPKSAHAMSAAPRPAHVTSAKPRPAHATSATPRPIHAMSTVPSHARVTHATPGPAHIKPATPEPVHKMAASPEPVQKMVDPLISSQVRAALSKTSQVTAVLHESSHSGSPCIKPSYSCCS